MKNFELMRPKKLYADILQQREKDGTDFANKCSQDFVTTVCPACDNKGEEVFEKFGFKHRVCGECKTMFCSPRPSDELLAEYYNNYGAPQMWTELLLNVDANRKAVQYRPRVEDILSVIKQNGDVQNGVALDLGAGSGAFSLCLKETGFFKDVISLDFSESCVEACKKQGLNALLGRVDDLDSESVDLICMNDLIEHVFDPYVFLRECFRVLKKNGFISIATPNGEGFDFKILKDKTKNITPPEHLTYFNPHSLSLILKRAGFDTVSVETPGKLDVEMILKEKKEWGYPLKDKNEYLDYLFEQGDDVLTSFQKFLVENKLSSHMLILGKKN